jgi:biopolymer transport protein ExbD
MIEIPVRPRNTQMNMTPLIDIVFLLLIFFLLTTHFIEEDSIGVKLPAANGRQNVRTHSVVVSMTKEGLLFLDGKRLALKDLETRLHEALKDSDGAVVIRADREATLQAAVSIMEAARQAGADRIVVATLQETGGA